MAMFNKQIRFTGKHAEILQKFSMSKGTDQDISYVLKTNNERSIEQNVAVFNTRVSCYMVAGMIGIIFNKTAKPDHSSEANANIFYDALSNNHQNLYRIYHHMVLAHSDDLSPDLKIKKAFSVSEDDSISEQQRLEDYVRGGLEIIDEYLGKCQTYEEFCNSFYNLIIDSGLDDFKLDL